MKSKVFWPTVLIGLFAVTRWPGLLPWNFSAAYALMFCAGVYFPARLAWSLPFGVMFTTDLLLNWYYHAHYQTPFFSTDMIGNYLAYAALVLLGRQFNRQSAFVSLLAGGLLGSILFYLITNTFSWLAIPEYARTLAGWLTALTRGTAGWPSTWEFFRNNLLSGGLFTGLFVGAMKLAEATEPETEEESDAPVTEEAEGKPREAKA